MEKKKEVSCDVMYCYDCRNVLLQFNSNETENYTATYKADSKGIEFLDRSESYFTGDSEYLCPECGSTISFSRVSLEIMLFFEEYAKSNSTTYFSLKLAPNEEELEDLSLTEIKKRILQANLENTK